jgi:hypothetical protein
MNAPAPYTQCLPNRYHHATEADLQLTHLDPFPIRRQQLLNEVQANAGRDTRRQQVQKLGFTVTVEPAA